MQTPSRNRTLGLLVPILLLCTLVACTSNAVAPTIPLYQPTTTLATTGLSTPTQPIRPIPPTPTITEPNRPTPSPQPTQTPSTTPTSLPPDPPTIAQPDITPKSVGEPIVASGETIRWENFMHLAKVAQWGKGNILGTAFTPDGSAFVVGSAFGVAIYSLQTLENPPQWVPFEQPSYYENLFFNADGDRILLENPRAGAQKLQIRRYPEGDVLPLSAAAQITWLKTSVLSESWGSMQVNTMDGRLRFKSHVTHDEEYWDHEFSVREVFDAAKGELLFILPDETIQIEYEDHHEPEGCDLSSFSYCGNVYSPNAAHPYRVAFSPSSESLSILYRPPNLWNSNRFSTLRVYAASTGQVLVSIGSLDHPVETFAYSPDGKLLLVAFVDGSLQLWNIAKQQETFTAWHFNSPMIDLEYTVQGKYLIMQRSSSVEVRLTRDGSLRGRYPAVAFAVSPLVNQLALGDDAGRLRVFDLDTGRTIFEIQAHEAKIYALAFSPDGQRITSSGQDCAVRNWDATTGEYIHSFAENTTDAYLEGNTASRIFVYYLSYVPGTDHLLGYGSWSRVASWDVDSGATQYLIEPDPLEYYQGLITLNPHFPEFFGVNLNEQEFYIDYATYAIESGEKLDEFIPPAQLPEGCAPAGPVTADGQVRFTKGYDHHVGQVCVLNADTYELLATLEVLPQDSVNHGVDINWLYLSPAKDQLIVSLYGGSLSVYQILP